MVVSLVGGWSAWQGLSGRFTFLSLSSDVLREPEFLKKF